MRLELKLMCLPFAALVAGPSPATGSKSEYKLDNVLKNWDIDQHHDLRGAVVICRGRVVAERYFNGETSSTLHDVRSAGKSVTALLMGIAIDEHFIRRPDAHVEEYWKESRGTAIGSVPITDVLTMRSGLAAFDADPLSPGQEDKLDEAPDPLAFILDLPRSDDPGTAYRYNSVTASVAGIVVAKSTGRKMESFAKEKLFAPLGIKNWQWASDAGGFTKGQGNLSLTLRDFAAIGELVRNGGRYRGRQIVSNEWIKHALSPLVHISAVDPYADDYGYFWYHKTQMVSGRPVSVWFASGNGGNKIYVIPDRAMVMAITSSAYGRGYGQKRSEDMLKAVLASPADHRCPSA